MPVKPYFVLLLAWAAIPAFHCGYHLSALNQLQAALTCQLPISTHSTPALSPSALPRLTLPPCIPMSESAFGLLTSMFTIGGLLGSLAAGWAMNVYGRKGAAVGCAWLVGAGSAGMALGANYWELLLGRFVLGIGTGMGVCTTPIYIAELAPPALRGSLCVLNQLSIVSGLLATQSLGIPLARPQTWRYVLVLSAALCAVQLAGARWMVDSPEWLVNQGRTGEAERAVGRMFGAPPAGEDEEVAAADETEPLLTHETIVHPPKELVTHTIGIWTLLTAPDLRKSVLVILCAFLAQQGSGINAILYYSNSILGKVMPGLAQYISVLITAVNLLMTFPPMFLVDVVGRKRMFLLSLAGGALALLLTALGINRSNEILSGVGVLGFVALFSIGMGPVPVIMMSELLPFYAVGSISALVGTFNSLINIALSMGFLPLRTLLAGQAGQAGEGNVFLVFVTVLVGCGAVVGRMYVPRAGGGQLVGGA